MKINEKIRQRRKELNMSLEDVAKIVGVNRSTILKYETGDTEKLPTSALIPIARALRCSPIYLLGLEDDDISEVNIKFDDYFPLHYSTNLSAGSLDELLDSEPDSVVYVPIKYQGMKKRLHAFKVNGTSMDNIIKDGSIVVTEDISHLSKIQDGTIVVALVNGYATVKRIYISDTSVTLMPDSSDKKHQPIIIDTAQEKVCIVGRVIWHINPDDMEKYY